MNEKTKREYISIAQNFLKTRLIDKNINVTQKNIRQALIACAPEYRPAYWRKLRCTLVTQQLDSGFSKAAKAIKETINPLTAADAVNEVKSLKKSKQRRRKHVEKEEHFLLRDYLQAKKDFASLAAIELARILGCRPAEMLTMKLLGNGKVFISGAKKTEDGKRGLDRTVILSTHDYNTVSQHKSNFYDEINKKGRQPDLAMNRVQHRLANVTKKLWPARKHQITLYSYRHQMGSDLKASGMDRVEVAAIMGHQSVDSVDVYGNKTRSSRQPSISATQDSINAVRKNIQKKNNIITLGDVSISHDKVPKRRQLKL